MRTTWPRWRPLLLVALVASAPACGLTGEPQQPGFVATRQFQSVQPVTQTFTPRVGPLNRVDVLVATYENPAPDAVLRLTVTGAGHTRRALAGRGDIPDADWLTFRFPPVPDAAGHTFAATLTYEGSDPIAYYVNPNNPYPGGRLDTGAGDLAFRVGHAGRVAGTLAAVRATVGDFAGRLARDSGFATIWALALVAGGVGLAVFSSSRTAPTDESTPARPNTETQQ